MSTMSYEQMQDMMGQTIMVVKSNAEDVSVLTSKVNGHSLLIGGLTKSMTVVEDNLKQVEEKVQQLEYSTEIKTDQVEKINELAKKRVIEILGKDEYEINKYFRRFISRLYSDAKRYGGLGNRISTTKSGNYQRVIDYIEAWTPSEGCAKLKESCDKKATAKALAKFNGYDC